MAETEMLMHITEHGILDRLRVQEMCRQPSLGVTNRIGDLLQRSIGEIVPGEERGGTIDHLGVYLGLGRSEHERIALRYLQITLYAIRRQLSVPLPGSNCVRPDTQLCDIVPALLSR